MKTRCQPIHRQQPNPGETTTKRGPPHQPPHPQPPHPPRQPPHPPRQPPHPPRQPPHPPRQPPHPPCQPPPHPPPCQPPPCQADAAPGAATARQTASAVQANIRFMISSSSSPRIASSTPHSIES